MEESMKITIGQMSGEEKIILFQSMLNYGQTNIFGYFDNEIVITKLNKFDNIDAANITVKCITELNKFLTKYTKFTPTNLHTFITTAQFLVTELKNIVIKNEINEKIQEHLEDPESDIISNLKRNIIHTLCEYSKQYAQLTVIQDDLDLNEERECYYHTHPMKNGIYEKFIEIFTYYKNITDTFSQYPDEEFTAEFIEIINEMSMRFLSEVNDTYLQSINYMNNEGGSHINNFYIDENEKKHIVMDTFTLFMIQLRNTMNNGNYKLFSYIVENIINYSVDYVKNDDDDINMNNSSFFTFLSTYVKDGSTQIGRYFKIIKDINEKLEKFSQ